MNSVTQIKYKSVLSSNLTEKYFTGLNVKMRVKKSHDLRNTKKKSIYCL